MLDSRLKGYAVMSPDLKGISFDNESFETCKRYCFNGDVIVEAIPYKCGIMVRLRFHRHNPWFRFNRYEKVFLKTRILFDYEYSHKYGKVLYTNPLNRTESINEGIVDY